MPYDFIKVAVGASSKTIARTAIALIEPMPIGTKITLNVKDEADKQVIIIALDSYNDVVRLIALP